MTKRHCRHLKTRHLALQTPGDLLEWCETCGAVRCHRAHGASTKWESPALRSETSSPVDRLGPEPPNTDEFSQPR